MNIVIDLDETVIDLLNPWLSIYNIQWNDTLSIDKLLTYEIHKYVKPECGEKIYDILTSPRLFSHASAFPGAITALQYLMSIGIHRIIIATTVYPRNGSEAIELDKRQWCKENLWFIPEEDIIITKDKYLIEGDIFIDDNPEQVINYRKHHPNATIIGIEYPYNKDMKEYDIKVPRGAMSWMNILNAITHIHYQKIHT